MILELAFTNCCKAFSKHLKGDRRGVSIHLPLEWSSRSGRRCIPPPGPSERRDMRPFASVLFICGLAASARAQSYPGPVVYPYSPAAVSGDAVIYAQPPTGVVIVNSPQATLAGGRRGHAWRAKTYMIAFKGGKVSLADQYWVTGHTLSYVTPYHERMDAPVETVDRELSERLNREQNTTFTLPPAQQPSRSSRGSAAAASCSSRFECGQQAKKLRR